MNTNLKGIGGMVFGTILTTSVGLIVKNLWDNYLEDKFEDAIESIRDKITKKRKAC